MLRILHQDSLVYLLKHKYKFTVHKKICLSSKAWLHIRNTMIQAATSESKLYKRIVSSDDKKAEAFFAAVINDLGISSRQDVNIIVVNHIVPTLPFFLKGLEYLAKVVAVIPKGSTIDSNVMNVLKDLYNIKNITREQLKEGENIIELIDPYVKNGSKCVIVDVGGYFASCIDKLKSKEYIRDGILGIVEDTENGHQKYERVQLDSPWPITSVARCELKKAEDFNVGKSIFRATDTILREDAHTVIERMQVGVIGFGKIGQSIAFHLQRNYVSTVRIFDSNPVAQMHAASLAFDVAEREQLLRKSDLIFCATGNKALINNDFEFP